MGYILFALKAGVRMSPYPMEITCEAGVRSSISGPGALPQASRLGNPQTCVLDECMPLLCPQFMSELGCGGIPGRMPWAAE